LDKPKSKGTEKQAIFTSFPLLAALAESPNEAKVSQNHFKLYINFEIYGIDV